jgi:hypothetical protein
MREPVDWPSFGGLKEVDLIDHRAIQNAMVPAMLKNRRRCAATRMHFC